MTHKEHAARLVTALWRANTATHGERVAIIAAALEKQRDACQSELEQQLGGILLTHPWMGCPDVRNAEVKE